MSSREDDKDASLYNPRFMNAAFLEARESLSRGEVPVGCVFVHRGRIVAAAGNDVNETRNPTR